MEATGKGADWAERTYEAMAPVYDDFTAHHDYDAWLADLLEAAERRGLSGKRLLDVGCGTGKSFLPLLPRGWEVTACDLSPSMLELAREKVGEAVRLEVADMRELPVFGEFDLIWCLDDAINYLLSEEELERALARMRANLAPTGLLAFDVNALLAYRTFFSGTEIVERGGRRLVWRGQAAADVEPGSICESTLEVTPLEPAEGGETITLSHRQRHFPRDQVMAAIERAGLECLDVYGHGYDGIFKQPLDESTHTKAIYIARAAGA
jgi:SAM-dependent methyltransferase